MRNTKKKHEKRGELKKTEKNINEFEISRKIKQKSLGIWKPRKI